jgi:RNA polymerase sigma-70 factor (ECF subfamily)
MVTAIAVRTPGSDDESVSSLQDPSVSHPQPQFEFVASSPTVFETTILPHLDAAYNLACWLVRAPVDAETIVWEACIPALRGPAAIRSGDERVWLLQIVRNAVYAELRTRRFGEAIGSCSAGLGNNDIGVDRALFNSGPDANVAAVRGREQVDAAVGALPIELRECVILREVEELSYREIARITEVPIDMVAARLSRARRLLTVSWDLDREVP